MNTTKAIGVDFGGTSVKLGVGRDGVIVEREKIIPTRQDGNSTALIGERLFGKLMNTVRERTEKTFWDNLQIVPVRPRKFLDCERGGYSHWRWPRLVKNRAMEVERIARAANSVEQFRFERPIGREASEPIKSVKTKKDLLTR
jgi:hypothetical protein